MNVPFILVSICLPVHDIETAEPLFFLDNIKQMFLNGMRHIFMKKRKRLKTFPDFAVTSDWVDKYTQPLHRQRCPCC